MLLQKNNAQKFSLPGGTNGLIYPHDNQDDFTVAYVEMDGTYPVSGYSINDYCTETIAMIEGELELEMDGNIFNLLAGDVFVIKPKNKYRLKGRGKSFDFITPAWDKKQNHII